MKILKIRLYHKWILINASPFQHLVLNNKRARNRENRKLFPIFLKISSSDFTLFHFAVLLIRSSVFIRFHFLLLLVPLLVLRVENVKIFKIFNRNKRITNNEWVSIINPTFFVLLLIITMSILYSPLILYFISANPKSKQFKSRSFFWSSFLILTKHHSSRFFFCFSDPSWGTGIVKCNVCVITQSYI